VTTALRLSYGRCSMSSRMKAKTTLYILLLDATWIVRTPYDRCRCVCKDWRFPLASLYALILTLISVWPFFLNLVCEAIGTAATPSLFWQPRVIVTMIVEKHMECRLAGETEVLGETLPQRHFCPSQNPTWPDPGRRGGKPATNRLSYGAAWRHLWI
jgi:hypothetical protein